ncbi:MAG: MATE family efflux transporter [Rhodobacteraceae bacterium]|nr:MATE family efflux transporter [Paracoccaceae bacterium]
MSQQGRFLTGSTMGHVARMTMTGTVGITFVFLVDVVNLFWIAKLGDPGLVAAIGFAFAIQFFSVSSGIGLMIASTALISRYIGSGDLVLARLTATGALITAFVIQSTMALFIFLFRHELVEMAGATGETAALAARYLAISVPSLGIMAVSMIASGALRAQGDGKRSMMVTMTSGGVAMVVDPFLILGLGMGLDGAAWGLVLSRFVMLGMALRFAIGTHDLLAPPRFECVQVSIRPYLAIAVPAITTQLATPVGNYLLTRVMAQYGDEAMAGWAVVGRLTVVAFGGIFSLSGAIGGIFGQNYGAGRYDRVRRTYRDALVFGLFYSLVTWGLLAVFGGQVAQAFGLTQPGREVVVSFTMIGAGGFIFAGAMFVSNAAFNSLGRPARSSLVNWLRDGVLTLPLAWWLAGWYGAQGVVYAQAAASVLVGVGAALWGWHYVNCLARQTQTALDLAPPRAHAHADRFRRR